MVDLVQKVNSLHEVLTSSGMSLELGLPRIVVVGGQSAGKSSVLEAFVGKDFLPRGSEIVTRRPLVLQLHQSEEEYATFLHTGERRFTVGQEVRREIEEETERETGKRKGVSEKEIILRIYSPNVVDLTLVDLPGMTKVAVGDQPLDIEVQIVDMIYKYIREEDTIILAVTPANQDLANSDALKVARDVDPDGQRTIGVITKLDLMDKGTNARSVLENEALPLKKGFIGVVNRSQADINNQHTIDDAMMAEKQFFLNSPYKDIMERHGMKHLQNVLKEELEEAIRRKLPEIRNRLVSKQLDTKDSLDSLGYEESSNQEVSMTKLVAKFTDALNGKLDGEGRYVETDRINIGPIINRKFYNEFSHIIVNPFKTNPDLDKEIRNANANAHGLMAPTFPQEKVLQQVAGKIISYYEPAMVRCVEEIEGELEKVVQESLDVVDGFPPLKREVESLAREQIKRGKAETVDLLVKHVKAEQAFMNLRHPQFRFLEQSSETDTETYNGHPSAAKTVGKDVGRAVGSAVGGAAGGAAGTSVGGPVGGAVGGGMGKIVGGEVGKAVGGAVGDKMGDGRRGADDNIEAPSPETKKKGGWLNGKKLGGLYKTGSKYESTPSLSPEPDNRQQVAHATTNNTSKPHRHPPPPPNRKTPVRVSKENEAISKEPKIREEAKTVKEMVGDYLEIVHIIMRDQAPKYIMFSLVQALQDYLKYNILNDLLERHPTKKEWEKLVQWEESSQVARLLTNKEEIRQALEVVDGFSQMESQFEEKAAAGK